LDNLVQFTNLVLIRSDYINNGRAHPYEVLKMLIEVTSEGADIMFFFKQKGCKYKDCFWLEPLHSGQKHILSIKTQNLKHKLTTLLQKIVIPFAWRPL
jgi:hypothetical protein